MDKSRTNISVLSITWSRRNGTDNKKPMDTIYASCIASTPEQHRDNTDSSISKLYLFEACETVGVTNSRTSKGAFALQKLTYPRSLLISSSSEDWLRLSVRTSAEKYTSITPNLGQRYESAVVFSSKRKDITVYNSPNHEYLSIGIHSSAIADSLKKRIESTIENNESIINHVSPAFRQSLITDISALLEQPIPQDGFNSRVEALIASATIEIANTDQTHISDNRARIVALAIDVIIKNEGKKISMQSLAQACHCSIRTLEYAFKSRLELSPKEFLTYYRLNRYRQEILSNPSATLSQLAYELQFKHLGNLAKNYRNLFGSLPSAEAQAASESVS